MDKGFIKYLKEKRDVGKVVLVIALALILIFLGSGSRKTEVSESEGIEESLASMCSSIRGVGECSVMVYYGSDQKGEETVESVIVICDGADSSQVRLTLTEMLSSFFGIGANRIRIEKKK